MKPLAAQLTKYAAYHRDKRNVATHFVGIPMIVFGLMTLFFGVHAFVGYAVGLFVVFFYLRLDVGLGLATIAMYGAGLGIGGAAQAHWLVAGLGLFVVGWIIQFVGHWFEGRKPAFLDDLIGLLIGPLFVVSETAFFLGLRKPLQAEIEESVGPLRINPRRGVAAAAR